MSESATQVRGPTNVRGCVNCRALVDGDQSYCLKCGARQPGARTPPERLGPAEPLPVGAPPPPGIVAPARDWTPFVALGGLAALVLVLVLGVLIGRSGQSDGTKAAAAPQVITVQGGGAATPSSGSASGGTRAAIGAIQDDWPAGKSGWTVSLQTLPSGTSGSTVASAKAAAAAKGAKNVGVLDASNYTGLGSGYVIYSGVYSSPGKANAALGSLKKSFPGAQVIHVVPAGGGGGSAAAAATAATPTSSSQKQTGAQAIQQLNNCSGSACSKASRKVTKPIATPGAAPPTDNKPAGGGSGAQAFQ
jgi:hypothetical protein